MSATGIWNFIFYNFSLKTFSIYRVACNMLIRVTAVEVCDARDDDSSTAAGNKKINFLKCRKPS